MLDPGSRHLLLDALRPPPGYTLDRAFGTTFTLDLLSMMTAPVAFALFDRQQPDGSLTEDPIAVLQALRQHAANITIFCQAGQIAVPPDFQSLFVYLEDSIHPVIPPQAGMIFHPKVWYIRFRDIATGKQAHRLLCLTRNLTADRSWDTVLRLEGEPGETLRHPELERFAHSLIDMADAGRPLTPARADVIRTLGEQFAHTTWHPPAGFDQIRFWPLGDDGQDRWPFPKHKRRMLVISPFVSSGTLSRLTKGSRGSILLARPEAFDHLGGAAVRHLAERLVLSPTATAAIGDVPELASGTETRAGAPAEGLAFGQLEGLHAKLYVADDGWHARVWTGSANATDQAFHGNVEFLVELRGKKPLCGIDAVIGERPDKLGLRAMVEPYDPDQDAPLEPTEEEERQKSLDHAQRVIGSMQFTATCHRMDDDWWRLTLRGTPRSGQIGLDPNAFTLTVRPATLGAGSAIPAEISPNGILLDFPLTEPRITPFFAVNLRRDDLDVGFLLVATLVDAPENRAGRVLAQMLANREDFLRFLLLVLGDTESALDAFAGTAGSGNGQAAWLAGLSTTALLEPLLRAFSRDPDRIRDIEHILGELSPDGAIPAVLPEGWEAIWQPIAEALSARGSS